MRSWRWLIVSFSKLIAIVLGLVICRLTKSSVGFVFTALPVAVGLAAIQGGGHMRDLLNPSAAVKSVSTAVVISLTVGALVFSIVDIQAAGVAAAVMIFLLTGMIGLVVFDPRNLS